MIIATKVSIAQSNSIKGIVTDIKTNVEIENATIVDINTNKMVISNANGVFEFKKLFTNTTLEISCIGYETKKISTTNNANNMPFFSLGFFGEAKKSKSPAGASPGNL